MDGWMFPCSRNKHYSIILAFWATTLHPRPKCPFVIFFSLNQKLLSKLNMSKEFYFEKQYQVSMKVPLRESCGGQVSPNTKWLGNKKGSF